MVKVSVGYEQASGSQGFLLRGITDSDGYLLEAPVEKDTYAIYMASIKRACSSKVRYKGEDKFIGACLDIGAQRTCIVLTHVQIYCRKKGEKPRLFPSTFAWRFGHDLRTNLGNMHIRIPKPHDSFVDIKLEVVSAEVPFLFRVDVLDKEGWKYNNVSKGLECREKGWTMPIVRNREHMYLTWKVYVVLFTLR